MNRFESARDAKTFLIEQIVQQEERACVSLAEIERKMLYFSDTDWTLPDIAEVNEQFEGEYDADVYEKKMANIIRDSVKQAAKAARRWLTLGQMPSGSCARRIIILLAMIDAGWLSPFHLTSPADRNHADDEPRYSETALYRCDFAVAENPPTAAGSNEQPAGKPWGPSTLYGCESSRHSRKP